jgi:hypothetical protein
MGGIRGRKYDGQAAPRRGDSRTDRGIDSSRETGRFRYRDDPLAKKDLTSDRTIESPVGQKSVPGKAVFVSLCDGKTRHVFGFLSLPRRIPQSQSAVGFQHAAQE